MQTNTNATHHQCKPTSMQTNHQCKPASMQTNINATQHRCKPTSMQSNIIANSHQCKPIINANQHQGNPHQCKPITQTTHEWTKQQHMIRIRSNACIHKVFRAPGGGQPKLKSCWALPLVFVKPMTYQHFYEIIETRQVLYGFLNFENPTI